MAKDYEKPDPAAEAAKKETWLQQLREQRRREEAMDAAARQQGADAVERIKRGEPPRIPDDSRSLRQLADERSAALKEEARRHFGEPAKAAQSVEPVLKEGSGQSLQELQAQLALEQHERLARERKEEEEAATQRREDLARQQREDQAATAAVQEDERRAWEQRRNPSQAELEAAWRQNEAFEERDPVIPKPKPAKPSGGSRALITEPTRQSENPTQTPTREERIKAIRAVHERSQQRGAPVKPAKGDDDSWDPSKGPPPNYKYHGPHR